jgi:hypothetical protein
VSEKGGAVGCLGVLVEVRLLGKGLAIAFHFCGVEAVVVMVVMMVGRGYRGDRYRDESISGNEQRKQR